MTIILPTIGPFVRTQAHSAWMAGYVPGRADFEDFEAKVQGGVNGDDGGTYAPSTPIVFESGAADDDVTVLTGPIKICYGGQLTVRDGAIILMPGAQFEELSADHPGRARTLLTSF